MNPIDVKGRIMIGAGTMVDEDDVVEARCASLFYDVVLLGVCIPRGFVLDSLAIGGVEQSVSVCHARGGAHWYDVEGLLVERDVEVTIGCRNTSGRELPFGWFLVVA